MSSAPVWGLESSSHAYARSSVSAYFASLAALCFSLLTTISSFVDSLAMRVPSSCCPVCQYNRLREAHLNKKKRKEEKITVLVFDCDTGINTLKRREDIDGESAMQFIQVALVIPILTGHIVEKAIYRSGLPSSAQSIKVQLPKGTKSLAEVRIDDARKGRRVIDSVYFVSGKIKTQTATSTKDAHEDQRAELPVSELFNQKDLPPELPANEISPTPVPPDPPPIPHTSLPTPKLLPPLPSPKRLKASTRLVPPQDSFPEEFFTGEQYEECKHSDSLPTE